jgi:hypothetical protein
VDVKYGDPGIAGVSFLVAAGPVSEAVMIGFTLLCLLVERSL